MLTTDAEKKVPFEVHVKNGFLLMSNGQRIKVHPSADKPVFMKVPDDISFNDARVAVAANRVAYVNEDMKKEIMKNAEMSAKAKKEKVQG